MVNPDGNSLNSGSRLFEASAAGCGEAHLAAAADGVLVAGGDGGVGQAKIVASAEPR